MLEPSLLLICHSPCARSFDYDSPYIVGLGQGRIIQGMDRGLMGTCLLERRRITIPPQLGYGTRGVGQIIPPNSTLVFYIRLIKLERVSCGYVLSTYRAGGIFISRRLCDVIVNSISEDIIEPILQSVQRWVGGPFLS